MESAQADGGYATYENTRGYGWYEWLNPSEVFGDIMIDYSYVECSMASNGALARFREACPDHRAAEISAALKRGNAFLRSIQRADGSWYGSWACCFTYAGWFGIEGLVDSGEDLRANQPASWDVGAKLQKSLARSHRSRFGRFLDESIALVEFSKQSGSDCVKTFEYAHIEVGLKI